jgi:DNA-binding transcriptional MerR regulator
MKIGDLARRTGTTCDVLRVWERRYGLLRPRRTAGGHRLYSTLDEQRVRLMLRHRAAGRRPAQAAELTSAVRLGVGLGDAEAVVAAEADDSRRELRRAFDAFDETAALRVIERLLASHTLLAVIRDVVVPSLRELDDRRPATPLEAARTRFAAAFLAARLGALARGWDRGPGPRALLACPPGEHHGALLAVLGIALHQCGWRIVSLGADTSLELVIAAAERIDPAVIVLTAADPTRFGPDDALRRLVASWRCVLGGPGASDDLAARCGAWYVGDEPVDAAFAVLGLPA